MSEVPDVHGYTSQGCSYVYTLLGVFVLYVEGRNYAPN